MTVKELIELLETVENKELEIAFDSGARYDDIDGLKTIECNDNTKFICLY